MFPKADHGDMFMLSQEGVRTQCGDFTSVCGYLKAAAIITQTP